jgi:hypothetical protein
MTKRIRRLSRLSWFGFFVAAFAWVAQHGIGQGVADARCSAGGSHWGISNVAYQTGLMIGAGLLILAAEAAAIAVFRATSDASYESPPPVGRIRHVAIASMTANLIFLVIVLLDGIASIVDATCRNS